VGESINACRTSVGKPERRTHLKDLSVRIILKYIYYRNRIGGCGVASSGSELEPVTGCCEHGNEAIVLGVS
jgi:hypothetical protein